MNQSSNQDLFIFNFPTTFVPKQIEDRYKIFLENYHKPYETVIDYVNSNVLDIGMPGLTFTSLAQTKLYGKERAFRAATSPYDAYQKDLSITIKDVDFHVSYFILQDVMLYHYMKNRKKGSPFIEDFIVTILDEKRRELYKLHFQELVPISQSDFRLAYQNKQENLQTFTLSFHYNNLDIEFIPRYADNGSSEEIIEHYYDRLIINDPNNNPINNYPDDRCDNDSEIIG